MDQSMEDVQKSYDQVADEYSSRYFHELEHKPLDRALLGLLAERVGGLGLVADLGCGPGHVARYLHERGVSVLGIDLSPRMVELARKLNPGITFEQGNMAALFAEDEAWVGIVAFYSMIHFPRPQVVPVLHEFHRVLRPNGVLLLSFHAGQEVKHVEEWWGKPVSLEGVFFEREELEGYLREAGFTIEVSMQRAPYVEVEVQTQRVYLLAHKLPPAEAETHP
jgi:SAM-dependent methyltransferase